MSGKYWFCADFILINFSLIFLFRFNKLFCFLCCFIAYFCRIGVYIFLIFGSFSLIALRIIIGIDLFWIIIYFNWFIQGIFICFIQIIILICCIFIIIVISIVVIMIIIIVISTIIIIIFTIDSSFILIISFRFFYFFFFFLCSYLNKFIIFLFIWRRLSFLNTEATSAAQR